MEQGGIGYPGFRPRCGLHPGLRVRRASGTKKLIAFSGNNFYSIVRGKIKVDFISHGVAVYSQPRMKSAKRVESWVASFFVL
jgi:hypothetical protein